MVDKYWQELLASDKASIYEQKVKDANDTIKGFVSFSPKDSSLQEVAKKYNAHTNSVLQGVPFAIKNNIAVEQHVLSCASQLLSNFLSPISASAVTQLFAEGLVPVGLTNMDEFGMGSDSTNTIYGSVKNPWDITRTVGGSSGGSAAVVASGAVPFALGSDTGGSVRQPAGFCGLWGLKPSYGSVSRYGLVAFASSLDVIGVLAEHPKWLSCVFNAMKVQGKDARDASSHYPKTQPASDVKKVAICIPDTVDKAVSDAMNAAKAQYIKAGYQVEEIALSIFDYSPAVYINIASAEASTNLARFDGIRYGNRDGFADNPAELINSARSNGFGDEVKLRIITGGFVLRSGFQDQYYLKAQKLRQHIRKVMAQVFSSYDILVLPTTPNSAFKLDGEDALSPFQQKLADAYSVVANLTGEPSVSYPVAMNNGMPVGLQAMAPHYAEERLFNFVNNTYALFEHKYSPYATELFSHTQRDIKGDN